MDKKLGKDIIDKYLSGQATEAEKAAVETWFNQLSAKAKGAEIGDFSLLNERIKSGLPAGAYLEPKSVRLWPRWAAAASIAIAVFTGGYFYYNSQIVNPQSSIVNQTDIAPGKNGATLTLANGKKIYINDSAVGDIANEAGIKITKTKDGQLLYTVSPTGADAQDRGGFNTLTTTRGEQTQVRLPDGTLVFLNAESSLRYPTSFAKMDQREVALTGEGYFEVAKDKAHPFKVNSAGQSVEVLGTHFNINSYSNEGSVKTTLLEGSVKVSNLTTKISHLLKPNQQANLVNNKIAITQVEASDAIAWKEGSFMFNSETMETAMNKVARWYDVTIVYKDPSVKAETLFGSISRYENVSKVIAMLERTKVFKFEVSGKTITVSRNNTNTSP